MFIHGEKSMLQLLTTVFFLLCLFKHCHYPKKVYLLVGKITRLHSRTMLLWKRRVAFVNSCVFTQCNESSIKLRKRIHFCICLIIFVKLSPTRSSFVSQQLLCIHVLTDPSPSGGEVVLMNGRKEEVTETDNPGSAGSPCLPLITCQNGIIFC